MWQLKILNEQNQIATQAASQHSIIVGTINIIPDFLTRSELLNTPDTGMITHIVQGDYNPSDGDEIVVAGFKGASIYDENLTNIKTISYGPYTSYVNVVDVESDHIPELMVRGSWSEASSLLDNDGKVLWTAVEGDGIDDMAAGDTDGDGLLEFAVGHNGSTGVDLLDHKGNRLWNNAETGNVWHIEIYDLNADGLGEIVHSCSMMATIIMDGHGNIIKKPSFFTSGVSLSEFQLIRWPDSKSDFHVIAYAHYQDGSSIVTVSDLDSQVTAELKATGEINGDDTFGTLIKFKPNTPEYLAVLVPSPIYASSNSALLLIYDNSGTLIFTDQISTNAKSIAPVMLNDSAALLVGSESLIYEYRLTENSQ